MFIVVNNISNIVKFKQQGMFCTFCDNILGDDGSNHEKIVVMTLHLIDLLSQLKPTLTCTLANPSG